MVCDFQASGDWKNVVWDNVVWFYNIQISEFSVLYCASIVQ
jgi:hypothetical protein